MEFRANTLESLKPATYCSLLSGLCFFLLICIKEKFHITLKVMEVSLILAVIQFAFIFFLITAITYFYKITITKSGVSSYNPWKSFKCYHMQWNHMEHIKLRSILGYRYYYIWSETEQKDIWVPYQIKNKNNFVTEILRFTGEKNILLKTIKQA